MSRLTEYFVAAKCKDRTMLEQGYWIAGIVGAIAAVVGLFRLRKRGTTNVNQNAKVSGQSNTVNQRLDNNSSESNGD